jgi:hypothetical protein
MNRNTGTYQISFKNINCSDLTNIEVGVLPITKANIHGDFSKKYGTNFAGYPLAFKQFFELFNISEEQKQTNQYKQYKKFTNLYSTYETRKNSTLTIRLNT